MSKLIYTVGAASASALVALGLKSALWNNHDDDRVQTFDSAVCATTTSTSAFERQKEKAKDLIMRIKGEVGAPGVVVGVSIDGKTIWREGFGYANVETRTPCHEDTVMRIASISKSMTMAIIARLWEDKKLDLDAPIQEYVPKFPHKTFDGKKVDITTRLLVSHLAGIRHYVKKGEKEEAEFAPPRDEKDKDTTISTRKKEVFNKDKYSSVEQALTMFQDDELLSKPGTEYLYTTHGWTLISAVAEGAGKDKFATQAKRLFMQLGLQNTKLDEWEPIIYNRSNYYRINKARLVNVPFTDNSYKWAGGGFVSTVGDLLKFAHAMLYSYQWKPNMTVDNGKLITQFVTEQPMSPIPALPPGFLRPDTVNSMWTKVPLTKGVANGLKYRGDGYGMGWQVAPYMAEYGTTGGGDVQTFHACHSGAAVGASSILFILPTEIAKDSKTPPPKGVCVAILTNMESVGLMGLAHDIAKIFADSE